jgi:hypothetical protein
MTIEEIDRLCAVLRKHGVARACVADVDLTFGDPKESARADSTVNPGPKSCPCRHEEFQHGPDGCLQGCPIDLCLREGV